MSTNAEDALASVSVMRMKEETDYRCADYITQFSQSHPHEYGVDEICRKLMAEWCIKVVDRCAFTRDTAAIAMNMLDRFLMTEQGLCAMKDRNIFQLASMTCLYTAIKVHESEALQPKTIVQLSRGIFSVKEIEEMEVKILFAIKWRTSPPTALAFVQHFLKAVPHGSLNGGDHKVIFELAKIQTELTLSDYSYVCKNASSIAYAALANSIAFLEMKGGKGFLEVLAILIEIDEEEVFMIQKHFEKHVQDYDVFAVKTVSQQAQSEDSPKTTASTSVGGQSSPREVRVFDQ